MQHLRNQILVIFEITIISILHFNAVMLVGQQTEMESDSDVPEFFEATIISSNRDRFGNSLGEIISKEFLKIGIKVNLIRVIHDDWRERTLEHTLNDYPIHEDGGYDLSLVDFDEDTYEFRNIIAGTTVATDNLGMDIVGYNSNSEYIALVLQFKQEVDLKARQDIFDAIQNILYEDLPYLTINHQEAIFLHSPDLSVPDNFVQSLYFGDPNYVYQLNKLNGDENLTIWSKWHEFESFSLSPHTQNAFNVSPENKHRDYQMISGDRETVFSFQSSRIVNNLLFQELFIRNFNDPYKWEPLIAEREPEWDSDYTKATITLRKNITFSDGHPLTSHDVVESYMTYLNPINQELTETENFKHLNEYFKNDNDSIKIIDDFTVEFNLKKPHNYRMALFTAKILPIHLYGNHTNQKYPDKVFPAKVIIDDMMKDGSSNFSYGSGPYILHELIVDYSLPTVGFNRSLTPKNNIMVFEKKNNYWMDISGYPQQIRVELRNDFNYNPGRAPGYEFTTLQDKFDYIRSAEGHIILPGIITEYQNESTPKQYASQDIAIIEKELGVTYSSDFISLFQTIAINQHHPIFGTGTQTPLAKENPDLGIDAAKYIRKAMNHAIPRQRIIDEIYGGVGIPGILPMSYTIEGFNRSLPSPEYNLTLAKEYMEMAGYEFNPTTQNLFEEVYEFLVENPGVPVSIIAISALIGFIVYRFTTFRFRKWFKTRNLSKEEANLYMDQARKIAEESENKDQ